MTVKYHQISLCETFSDCQISFMDDSPAFFQLLSKYFDLADFIPPDFHSAFYHSIGRNRIYPLHGFLSAFILQKIFFIPTDSLLLLFLNLSPELRTFCGFTKVPDASILSRFKHDFQPYIEKMFQQMVDYTEHICQLIDSSLAKILTFDTSLIPVLTDYFSLHLAFHPDTFMGDSSFNSADIYGSLFHDFHFSKALIPYNPRNESTLKKLVTTDTDIPPVPMMPHFP